MKPLPSIELVRDLLNYNPSTGIFTWANPLQKARISRLAGWTNKENGYHFLRIDGYIYAGQRIAWLYINGTEPKGEIDHINGNRTDNRISNLRDVTQQQNCQNSTKAKGFGKYPYLKKFKAYIAINGKQKHLGYFSKEEDARAAYLKAKKELMEKQNLTFGGE